MWFFASLYRSLFDFRWLKERRNNSGSAWSYFFLFIFLISGLILIPLFVQMPGSLKELRIAAEKNVPDFQADLKGGQLTVNNLAQPYIVKEKDFVLVVDTATTTNIQVKNWLETPAMSGVLITKDQFEIYNAPEKSTRIQSWKDIPDYSTTKGDLLAMADKILKPAALYLIGLIMFVGAFIGLTVTKLLTLLIVTFLAFTINNFAKKGWTFKQLFNVGLFAVTLPSVLIIALGWVGGRVSFVYSLILLAVLLVVIFKKDNKENLV